MDKVNKYQEMSSIANNEILDNPISNEDDHKAVGKA